MSNAADRPLHDRVLDTGPARLLRSDAARRALVAPLSAVAFWAAIALPALYLPLLVTGLEAVSDLAVFLALFGLHVVALIAGRPHRRE